MRHLRIFAYVLAGVLGLGSAADACHNGSSSNHGKGIKGKISSVGKNSFTMHSGKTHRVLTVNFSNSSVKGAPHGTIDSSVVGEMADVIGAEEGSTINASQITISAPEHHNHAGKPAA